MGMTCACYNLRRTSRAVTQVFDAHFDAIGLKATQFTVLAALSYESEGRPTVNRVGRALLARGYPVWKEAQAAVAGALAPADFERQLRALRTVAKAALALRPERSGNPEPAPTPRETSRKSRAKTVVRGS